MKLSTTDRSRVHGGEKEGAKVFAASWKVNGRGEKRTGAKGRKQGRSGSVGSR